MAITGDRNWEQDRKPVIRAALATLNPERDFVILGDARGVDTLAREVCEELGLPHVVERAAWGTYGRAAGPRRNRAMLDHAPAQIWSFHDNLAQSRGTRNCVDQARKRGIMVRDGRKVAADGEENDEE